MTNNNEEHKDSHRDTNYQLASNHIQTIGQLEERYFCEGLVVDEFEDGHHTYFCVTCNKWLFYKDGAGDIKCWKTDKSEIKTKCYDHFLHKTNSKQHQRLSNDPNEKHVNYGRELNIMKNLGRICLDNIKDYGSDSKYERLVYQAFKLRVDVGQRLHSKYILDEFKKIYYEIVNHFFCCINNCLFLFMIINLICSI